VADDELPSIEEEFAQLDAELKRIAQLPVRTPEEQNAVILMLENLRNNWEEAYKAKEGAPAWRHSVDAAIVNAFEELLRNVRKGAADGTFRLDNEMVKRAIEPVLHELSAGLQKNLFDKFAKRPPPGTPPPKVDGADVAAILFSVFGPAPKKK
jgi:hypothetical protein